MPAQTKAVPATYADIEALPPHMTGQIVYGALHAHPRPAPKHALAASVLTGELLSPYGRGKGGPGGWIILIEPELHIDGHVLVPDLAGWRRERMPALPDTAYFETVPDWCCEVISPSTARLDRGEKRQVCAEIGVTHLWHIDPAAKTLEAFVLKDGAWMLLGARGEGDVADLPPFDAVPVEMDALWTL
jgi:Uma2 family endonuclease